MKWDTALEAQLRLYHFKFPCWFAWADPPEGFDDKIEEMLHERSKFELWADKYNHTLEVVRTVAQLLVLILQLIKYRFQTMFLKDKLTNAIPNLDSWIMEFVRLSRFRGLNDK